MENKLVEEVNEYLESKSESELADILEVVYRIAELRGLKQLDLEKIRKDKALAHGTFSKNYFLIDIEFRSGTDIQISIPLKNRWVP